MKTTTTTSLQSNQTDRTKTKQNKRSTIEPCSSVRKRKRRQRGLLITTTTRYKGAETSTICRITEQSRRRLSVHAHTKKE